MKSAHSLIAITLLGAALAGCNRTPEATVEPIEITRSTACSLDGMILADYPGPKAQIHYANQKEPEYFCDTMEMFSIYLNPEQARRVNAMYVQDMGKTPWEEPHGHWIDAKIAFYVHGSSKRGSMGPTIASFGIEADAKKFADEYGGQVLKFADVTPEMVALDGGALHDHSM